MVGGTFQDSLATTEIYNLERDEWRESPALPTPVERAAMVQDPGTMRPILVGGFNYVDGVGQNNEKRFNHSVVQCMQYIQ